MKQDRIALRQQISDAVFALAFQHNRTFEFALRMMPKELPDFMTETRMRFMNFLLLCQYYILHNVKRSLEVLRDVLVREELEDDFESAANLM